MAHTIQVWAHPRVVGLLLHMFIGQAGNRRSIFQHFSGFRYPGGHRA